MIVPATTALLSSRPSNASTTRKSPHTRQGSQPDIKLVTLTSNDSLFGDKVTLQDYRPHEIKNVMITNNKRESLTDSINELSPHLFNMKPRLKKEKRLRQQKGMPAIVTDL